MGKKSTSKRSFGIVEPVSLICVRPATPRRLNSAFPTCSLVLLQKNKSFSGPTTCNVYNSWNVAVMLTPAYKPSNKLFSYSRMVPQLQNFTNCYPQKFQSSRWLWKQPLLSQTVLYSKYLFRFQYWVKEKIQNCHIMGIICHRQFLRSSWKLSSMFLLRLYRANQNAERHC